MNHPTANIIGTQVSFRNSDQDAILITGNNTYKYLELKSDGNLKATYSQLSKKENNHLSSNYTAHCWLPFEGRFLVATDQGQIMLCENGEFNDHNFMTGCDCRYSNGTILPYHGWYCEVHNALLCAENKFYDLTKEIKKVGDTDPCRSCSWLMPGCEICKQDNETNCKLHKIRVSSVISE